MTSTLRLEKITAENLDVAMGSQLASKGKATVVSRSSPWQRKSAVPAARA